MKDDEMKKELLETMLPPLIQLLLDEKKITKNVSKKELDEKIDEMLKKNVIEDAKVSIIISTNTYKLFCELYSRKEYDVATIVGAAFIEQITNEFYQKYLINKKELTEKEIYNCLRSIPIRDKFGWFYKQSFNEKFNKKLYKFIDTFFTRRNILIHNIPDIKTFDEIEREDIIFDNTKIKQNIDSLINFFNKKESELYQSETTAKEIFEKYYKI